MSNKAQLSSGASDFTRLIFCSHGKAQNKCCILALIDKNSNKVKIMEITTAGILVPLNKGGPLIAFDTIKSLT